MNSFHRPRWALFRNTSFVLAFILMTGCSGLHGEDVSITSAAKKAISSDGTRPTIASEEGINYGHIHRDDRQVVDGSLNLGAEDPLMLVNETVRPAYPVDPQQQPADTGISQGELSRLVDSSVNSRINEVTLAELPRARNVSISTELHGRTGTVTHFNGDKEVGTNQ